jgi:hypothetical protein
MDADMNKRTPTPWIEKHQPNEQTYGACADYRYEVWMRGDDGGPSGNAEQPIAKCVGADDAAYIVRAVNSHEEMLGTLRHLVDWFKDYDFPGRAAWVEAVIAKAESRS